MNIVLYFFIYSTIGFLIETIYTFISDGHYSVRRSMLASPMCIVYGAGAVSIIIISMNTWNNIAMIFFSGMLVCTAVEYGASLLYESVCGVILWDYSAMRGNLRGRVCALYSVYWGIVTVVFCRIVHPAIEFLVQQMDIRLKIVLTATLIIYFRRDMVLTVREMKKLGRGEKSMCDAVLEYIEPAPDRKIF